MQEPVSIRRRLVPNRPMGVNRKSVRVRAMRSVVLVALIAGGCSVPKVEFLTGEFVFETAEFPRCHASTLAESKDGLVAAWFGGAHEKSPDVGIWVSRRVADRWTTPVEVANGIQAADTSGQQHRYPCWNPVLFQPAPVNGVCQPLLLFYKCGPDPEQWWGMMTRSHDGGVRFETPWRLPKGIDGPVKNKPIQLADGDILCGSSTEYAGWRIHFERTNDLGKTWRRIGPIHDAKRFNAIQPSILVHPGGRLQILCRSKEGSVVTSWSEDLGETWTRLEATELPNPNSGTDAVTLADGRQLLVYNHTRGTGKFPSGRDMLNVAISHDGKKWFAAAVLERAKGEYSYPAVIQTDDGHVHITYTWKRQRIKHVVIDPRCLTLEPITDSRWPKSVAIVTNENR